MRFIGITGGVGAGKSAILNYLEEQYHVKIMLADEIAEELMQPGKACYPKLQEIFRGDEVFFPNGVINRPAMAAVMFSDDTKRDAVNALVHPAVKLYVIKKCEEERRRGELDYLILEAALLIEEHYDEICDELWYIYTSKENRKKRLTESRGYTNQKVEQIFASQLSEEEYRRKCVKVIDNNGTTEETIAQLKKVIKSKGERIDGKCE